METFFIINPRSMLSQVSDTKPRNLNEGMGLGGGGC